MDFDYSIFAINYLGNWSYLIVFLVCFIETLAFIGTLVPGGFIVIAIGFLVAYTPLNIWVLILVGTIGAISGDTFSYYLGTKGVRWFKYENKLLKLSHLEKGKIFFKKHGHKSIFFGRFIGLIKPIVPFVAGLSKMDFKAFFFWDTISGALWAVLHLGIGYYLGISFEEFSISKRMELLFVTIPIAIVVIWSIAEYRERLHKTIGESL